MYTAKLFPSKTLQFNSKLCQLNCNARVYWVYGTIGIYYLVRKQIINTFWISIYQYTCKYMLFAYVFWITIEYVLEFLRYKKLSIDEFHHHWR